MIASSLKTNSSKASTHLVSSSFPSFPPLLSSPLPSLPLPSGLPPLPPSSPPSRSLHQSRMEQSSHLDLKDARLLFKGHPSLGLGQSLVHYSGPSIDNGALEDYLQPQSQL